MADGGWGIALAAQAKGTPPPRQRTQAANPGTKRDNKVDRGASAQPRGKATKPQQKPAEDYSDVPTLHPNLSLAHPPSRIRPKRRTRDDKPTALLRAWVRVDAQGQSNIVHADKLTLTQQLGIQPRDLRLLESQVANQSSVILCRERAIVINMAFIKAIITVDACYIVSPDDERAIQFMAELKHRLQAPLACSKSAGKQGGQAAEWAAAASQALQLPFELRVLEICLDELTSDLDERASQLEASAYPAVDAMAKLSTRPNLDRVRRVKNALIQLYKTTETFHEALEELLDNDRDMWEMNLGAKEAARQVAIDDAVAAATGPAGPSEAQHTQLAPVAEDEVLAPVAEDDVLKPVAEEGEIHFRGFGGMDEDEEQERLNYFQFGSLEDAMTAAGAERGAGEGEGGSVGAGQGEGGAKGRARRGKGRGMRRVGKRVAGVLVVVIGRVMVVVVMVVCKVMAVVVGRVMVVVVVVVGRWGLGSHFSSLWMHPAAP